MSKLRKHIYSPDTVILDMKKQPDAEAMLKIAKSIKGAKIEVIKSGQLVSIHYPKVKSRFCFRVRIKRPKGFWGNIGTGYIQSPSGKHTIHSDESDSQSDTRLYHAMIVK